MFFGTLVLVDGVAQFLWVSVCMIMQVKFHMQRHQFVSVCKHPQSHQQHFYFFWQWVQRVSNIVPRVVGIVENSLETLDLQNSCLFV